MSDLTIGAVMEVLGGEYFGGILRGIERVTRERHARLLVFRGIPADVAAAPFAREVRGWIAVHSPVGLPALARLGLPLVTVSYHDPEVGCPAVLADNSQGVREAVRHLIAHGHRRIAFIGWLEYPAIAERYEGYRDALTESGLPCSPELVISVEDNHLASGRAGARQLLEGGALPCTAVVGGTDLNAVGVMEVLQAAGLRVPEDVAVVGFDDVTAAELADPPLTTLRTRFDEFGRRAANFLLDDISGIAAPRTAHRVPVALIRRRSCGCDIIDNLALLPDAEALAARGNRALAAHLVRMALFPVQLEPGQVPGEIWPGVETLIGGIDAAQAGALEPNPTALRHAWQQAVHLTPDLDVLRAMSALLSRAGAQRLAAMPPDRNRADRLAGFLARSELELGRARMAYRHEEMTQLEELTQNSARVGMMLLSGKTGQAQELGWVGLTPAHWGCLALYTDATRAPTSTLSVAGTYRRSGPPLPGRGTHFIAGAFPPAEWCPAPGSAVGTDVLMLVPVASASRDWGVLALRGPIEAHGRYTARRPNNMALWGALLAAALERDALAARLAELADEDRKRAAQALQQSERYLAEAERLSHTGSWAFDVASDRYVYASEECGRIFEFDAQEDLPTREAISRLIHPEDWLRVNEAFEKTLRDKVDTASEFKITLPSGTVKHVHAIRHPVLNEAGEVVQLVGTVIDITERKRAGEALRRSEAYLAEGQRLSHAGSWAWNPLSEQCFFWSEEMFRIFEIDPQQGLPTSERFWARIHPEDRESMRALLRDTALEKTEYEHDHRIVLPDGTVKHIHAIGHPVLDGAGELVEFIGTAIDVTERKRAEEERERLRQLEAELAHINRVSMLGELTASIAHEVNQPLAGVVSNAGASLRWLAGDPPNLEKAREAVSRIGRDGKRAGEIIARIRALTRRAATPTEKLDLNQTIQDVLPLVGDEAKRKSVRIQTQFADDLSPVAGDRVQVQQVVLNLVLNGIEAMSSVADRPRELVITTRNVETDQVQVTVEDSGTGLDPTAMDKIFDPFYTTKPSGMGMGLSICRSILQAHGGRLWAEAKDGPGTIFHVMLPRYQEGERGPEDN